MAFALGMTIVVADSGPNQAAHYALVRSLASGTAEIDPGETIDASYVDGKYYAAKAPGLALFTLPWYGGLRAAGLQHGQPATEAGYRHRLWALNLWGCPADARAAAPHGVRRRARRTRLRAASGCPARLRIPPAPVRDALLRPRPLGHLGFAAFVALLPGWRVRAWLAGLAVAEFPLAIIALVLGVCAAVGARPARRLTTYTAGFVVGSCRCSPTTRGRSARPGRSATRTR